MNWNRLLITALLLVLISGCSSTPIKQEGGIGGTGHTKECSEHDEECHEK